MGSDHHYTVNEIFYSLQGEGARAGTANVFVRFSACNLKCAKDTHGFDCDTEFVSGRRMTAQQILAEAKITGGEKCEWIILTGGEPTLQVDAELVRVLAEEGRYMLAIETNGTNPVPEGIAWITLSPKVAEHAIAVTRCHEIKYVRGHGQGIPKPNPHIEITHHRFISPAAEGNRIDPRALAWCVELVKGNPEWRLSIQQHKTWQVR